jgi:hypothetical protein
LLPAYEHLRRDTWKAHAVSKANEWELLRRQFDALTRNERAESVEDVFDAQFRRRFVELINQIAQPDRTPGSIDWRQRQRTCLIEYYERDVR